MGNNKSSKQLAGFLSYVLGRNPDEFGLVPDQDGYVKIKELLKAVNEEDGWRHVRKALIDELLLVMPDSPIEIKDKFIRTVHRDHLQKDRYVQDPPRLLYAGITQKSYPFALEKGILPTYHLRVVLASTPEMAIRLGKRRDRNPILLTIQTSRAAENGAVFYQFGEQLYLAEFIPVGSFTGPPLPKHKDEPKKKEAPKEIKRDKMPGSFILDLHPGKNSKKKKKDLSWKRDRKQIRRENQKKWPT